MLIVVSTALGGAAHAGPTTVSAAATPQLSPAGGSYRAPQNVTITDSTSGATLYYTTDGTTPSQTSTPYTGPIPVATTETLKAIAAAPGYSRSAVAYGLYTIQLPAATPTFSPAAGSYNAPQSVSISDTTQGAVIYYTTDGTTPGTNSQVYAGPITVASTETLKAVAMAPGGSKSPVATALYRIVLPTTANPAFSPPAGTYYSPQQVNITDTTPGATIYYTTDGSAPTPGSSVYMAPLNVASSETINAIAIAPGYSQSVTVSSAYAIAMTSLTEAIAYSFTGSPDGKMPAAAVTMGSDGNLYGTTYHGGSNAVGSIFQLTPSGTETVLYSFSGGMQGSSDGKLPFTALIQATDGNFYGTTELGGANGVGTVYRLTPAGVESVLYSFGGAANGGADGVLPQAGLIQGADGNLYGTTAAGGANAAGTVFEISTAGQETVLYSFAGGTDGASPRAALLQGADGNFYGTTIAGGAKGQGTVFEVTPTGAETLLYSFNGSGGSGDGAEPVAALIQGADGSFYGTTEYGGAYNAGTVYRVSPPGTEVVLYSFGASSNDGTYPAAPLIQASDGNFYGTTVQSNGSGGGTVFEVTSAGVETVVYSFAAAGGSTDGAAPHAGLLQSGAGVFYGTTESGGASGLGTVFVLGPPGSSAVMRHLKRKR